MFNDHTHLHSLAQKGHPIVESFPCKLYSCLYKSHIMHTKGIYKFVKVMEIKSAEPPLSFKLVCIIIKDPEQTDQCHLLQPTNQLLHMGEKYFFVKCKKHRIHIGMVCYNTLNKKVHFIHLKIHIHPTSNPTEGRIKANILSFHETDRPV
jgi:hypothetical protein